MAATEEIVERAEALREAIRYHNERYFGEDEPEISGAEYDTLSGADCSLRGRAPGGRHPRFADAEPGRGLPADLVSVVRHHPSMLSLDNTLSRAS